MRNTLAALDVGTSKVCAIVAEVPIENEIAVLGYGVAPCAGLRKGVVVNIDATVEAIRAAVEEAERSSGTRIGSVVVGVAGAHIRGLNSHGIVAVRGGEVGPRDLDRVIEAARAVAIPLDRQVLHILPQQFAVDDQEGVRDPIGMAGVRLEARIHIVTAAQSYEANLTKCCERAGVTPSELVFEPLASADAALFPEERELGVALLDIGGGTTDIIVFHGGSVHSRGDYRAADGRDFCDGAARADALGGRGQPRFGTGAGRRHFAAGGNAGTGGTRLQSSGAARTADEFERNA
jgi:cell division protein FtsA